MKKFKILCVLLLTVYLISIVSNLVSIFISETRMCNNLNEYTKQKNLTERSFIYLDVNCEGKDTYKPNAINNVTKDSVALVSNNVSIIEYAKSFEHDKENILWNNILDFSNWIILVIYIYLIVVFIKIMRLFIKKQVFEKKIISLLNHSGIAFIILSFIYTAWEFGRTLIADRLIDIENVSISYRNCVDWNSLMTGLVILVITEILRQATTIKEEQDLTI